MLPNETTDQYEDLGERFPGGDRYPGFTGFLTARMAAYYRYGMCGITDRWEELHGDEKLWEKFNREKPSDWTNLQVKGAKRGMAISHAGVGSHVTSTI